jgi:hypothetical protein
VENQLGRASPSWSPNGGAVGGGREVVVYCVERDPIPLYIEGGVAAPKGYLHLFHFQLVDFPLMSGPSTHA